MNKLKETKQKSQRTIIALVIIGITVYLGFTPLFELIQGGVAGAVVGASFGAIFVIVLTMYLLNQQTEIEQESKKSERIFDEKVKLYYSIYEEIESMLEDGKISREDEIKKLPFVMTRLITIGSDEVIESFTGIYKQIIAVYNNDPKNDAVLIKPQDEGVLIKHLLEFAKVCRLDLGVSDVPVNTKLMTQSLDNVEQSTKIVTGRFEEKDPSMPVVSFATFDLNGREHTIKRYEDTSIRIYINGEYYDGKVKPVQRDINDEFNLGFTKEDFKKLNTRTIGKRMIDLLPPNSVK